MPVPRLVPASVVSPVPPPLDFDSPPTPVTLQDIPAPTPTPKYFNPVFEFTLTVTAGPKPARKVISTPDVPAQPGGEHDGMPAARLAITSKMPSPLGSTKLIGFPPTYAYVLIPPRQPDGIGLGVEPARRKFTVPRPRHWTRVHEGGRVEEDASLGRLRDRIEGHSRARARTREASFTARPARRSVLLLAAGCWLFWAVGVRRWCSGQGRGFGRAAKAAWP